MFAEVAGSAHHAAARELLVECAEGAAPWAIPWPCVYEFLRVVTHGRVFHPRVPLDVAMRDLRSILQSPSLVLLAETDRHLDIAAPMLARAGATGNLVHDAHIAALCVEHGVRELLSADRDFARFPEVKVRNPFQ